MDRAYRLEALPRFARCVGRILSCCVNRIRGYLLPAGISSSDALHHQKQCVPRAKGWDFGTLLSCYSSPLCRHIWICRHYSQPLPGAYVLFSAVFGLLGIAESLPNHRRRAAGILRLASILVSAILLAIVVFYPELVIRF